MKITLGARFAGTMPDPDSIAYVLPLFKPQFDTLEQILSKNGPFLTGDNCTIADLQIYYTCTLEFYWERNFDAYPKIDAWMKKMYEIKEVKEIQDQYTEFITKEKAALKEKSA